MSPSLAPAQTPPGAVGPRLLGWVCSGLIAAPWFWPILLPPRYEFWPDMLSWSAGALLLALLPWVRERADESIAGGWLLAALGSAVLALLQYLDLENGLFPWVVATRPGNATANVHQTNMLATLLAVGLLSLWWLGVRQRLRPVHRVWMAGLLIAALAATASRTGMLHLLIIAALLFFWHRQAWRAVLGVVLGAGAFYLFSAWGLQALASLFSGAEVPRDIASRFDADNLCHSRLVLWANVLELIALRPWTGWGPGELLFAHYITLFEGQRYCAKLSNAHNLPLQMAVTLGVPLTALLLAILGWFIARLRPWAETGATARWLWAVWLLIGVHSLLEFPLWFGVFQLMAALATRQLIVARGGALAQALSSRRQTAVVSALALASLAAVTWDYVKVSQIFLPDRRRLTWFRTDTYAKARTAWLYDGHVKMAQAVMTPLNPKTAPALLQWSLESLHLAPDAPVIQRVIEAAELAGEPALAEFHRVRFQAAWPQAYERWRALRAPQNDRSFRPVSPAGEPR